MNSLYLWVNIGTLLFPLLLSFDSRIAFYKNWKFLFPAIFITAVVFIIWDQWFAQMNIWGFNAKYLLGYYFFELPVEEVMFFFTIPYACVFIYETLRGYLKKSELFEDLHRWFTLLFFGVAVSLLYWYNDKLYTAITCLILSFMLGTHLIVIRRRYMSWMYFSFLISLLPMLIVNGILTSRPVVYYDIEEQTGFKLGSIPVEDFLYNLILLAMCTGIYEWLKRLAHRNRLHPRKQST